MTVECKAGHDAIISCDDCGTTLTGKDLSGLMSNAVASKWKLENLESGVEHYCNHCGKKPEHELATRLRQTIAFSGKLSIADERGSGDATGLLDNIVQSAAKHGGASSPVDNNHEDVEEFSLDFGD